MERLFRSVYDIESTALHKFVDFIQKVFFYVDHRWHENKDGFSCEWDYIEKIFKQIVISFCAPILDCILRNWLYF